MLLTRHFVFIHVMKTGGSTVRKTLEDIAPPEWRLQDVGLHPTHADIPASHAELPRLAFVRNPYAWYVSWFHFQREKVRDDYWLEISDNGRLGFADSMRRALTGSPALALGEGPFLQYLWTALGRGLEGVHVGRMEHLGPDLLRMLRKCCDLEPAMIEAIERIPVRNASTHAHYVRYYDDELRQLVAEKDGPIFDHFGYAWEDRD